MNGSSRVGARRLELIPAATFALLLTVLLAGGPGAGAADGLADYWPADSWPQWRRDPAKNAFNPVSTLPAISPETFWRYSTPANAANSSPAVVNGRVYVGSDGGYLYCFDALTADPNGTRLWE